MRRASYAIIVLALVAGCRSVNVATTGAGGASSSSSTTSATTKAATSTTNATTSTGAIPTITFSARVVPNGPGAAVVGANLCVYAHPEMPCAQSASDGSFDLAIPAKDDTAILITKAGFGSILIPIETTSADMSGAVIGMPKLAAIQSFYMGAGTPYPNPGKGFLAVFFTVGDAFNQGSAGAFTTLVPASGSGPFYADPTDTMADASLAATSSGGLVRFGALAPGLLEIDATCAAPKVPQSNFFGWPTSDISKVRAPIVDGFETRIGFGCY